MRRHLGRGAVSAVLALVSGMLALIAATTTALAFLGGGNVTQGLWVVQQAWRAPQLSPSRPTFSPAPAHFAVRVVAPSPTAERLPTPKPSPSPTPTSTPTKAPAATPPPRIQAIAQQHGINVSGRYIVVDQAEQRMYIVDGDVLVRVLRVSTGDPAHGWFTPPWVGRVGVYWGTFSARGVYADEGWHLFQTPSGNILIHAAPYTLDANGRKVYQDLDKLGEAPASRGCIRLAPEDARWFTEWGPAGVPIVILPHPLDRR